MTGLDPVEDRILEVAAIATDWDFQEVGRFEAAVWVDPELAKARMTGAFWDEHKKTRRQLLEQSSKGRPIAAVEDDLLGFVQQNFAKNQPIYLAGNSIHQDRKFIANHLQQLEVKLHYRMLDVSAFKLVFEHKFDRPVKKPDHHRALQDIEGSIAELKYYLEFVDCEKS